jgi:hypothetical protein
MDRRTIIAIVASLGIYYAWLAWRGPQTPTEPVPEPDPAALASPTPPAVVPSPVALPEAPAELVPLTACGTTYAVNTVGGAFTDVVEDTAKRLNLYADGYGITGVCNDSVAVVQQAVTGNASQYPLLMNDSVLLGELQRRLSDGDRTGDATYRSLKKAIGELPSDARPNPSAARRALQSIPWESGREPFQSTVDARRILGG